MTFLGILMILGPLKKIAKLGDILIFKLSLVALLTVLGSVCFAQNSSELAMPSDPKIASNGGPGPSGENIMEIPQAAPKWQTYIISETTSANFKSIDSLGNKSSTVSDSGVGPVRNFDSGLSLIVAPIFEFATNHQNQDGKTAQLHQNDLEFSSVMIKLTKTTELKIGNSTPLNWGLRYYTPSDRVAKDSHQAGVLRFDALTEWMLTPRWSIGAWFSPRIQLNTADNPNTAVGSDADYYDYRMTPSLNYYFNDKLIGYYAYTWDPRASQAQRGDWRPDVYNTSAHEVGLYWTLGSVLINPSITSETENNNGDSSLFTADSRVWSDTSTVVNLNFYATF